MQAFKSHKIAIIAVFLAAIIIVSAFVVQNYSRPSPITSPSPSPTPTQNPTQTPSISPTPTVSSFPTSPPNNFSPFPFITPGPTLNTTRYLGEITQYQGIALSPINAVYQNAIAGLQYIDQTTYRLTVTGLVKIR